GAGASPRFVRRTDDRLSLRKRRERWLAGPGARSLRHDTGAEALHGRVAAAAGGNCQNDSRRAETRTNRVAAEPEHSSDYAHKVQLVRRRISHRRQARRLSYVPGNRPAFRSRCAAWTKDRLLSRPAREPAHRRIARART